MYFVGRKDRSDTGRKLLMCYGAVADSGDKAQRALEHCEMDGMNSS